MAEVNPSTTATTYPLPRVAIQFCTQCKWMLRAAYFAQELLSTFSTSLGEVALQPSTGGTFTVTLTHQPPGAATTSSTILWDRKTEGGFPETKELKRRLRDVIEPDRDLGHVDRKHSKAPAAEPSSATMGKDQENGSGSLPSAADVTPHLKKHPANANKIADTADKGDNSPFDDAAKAAIAAAGANKGQQAKAEVSPPGKLQLQKKQDDAKEACEDCA
ncbi:selT/selW/selH selenoprotein domain-containing protein [Colletotrichum gloeosporioides Cg-14]|uniref:SelT/selW/selH selenoprotein domain-containing protein n=1 Tax=Colletotrichum gloeosporioides (strain Cg-14) TaxID=1237896 RepID=T0KZZ4_COLGC|nr:selT/selW/selH selenoprotein domain-containing protein [Colletotrichum gloeosporioides Cg-14]